MMVGTDVAVPVSVEPPVIETPAVVLEEAAAAVVDPLAGDAVFDAVFAVFVAAVSVLPVDDACACVAVERLGRSPPPPVDESAAEAIPISERATAAESSWLLRENRILYLFPPSLDFSTSRLEVFRVTQPRVGWVYGGVSVAMRRGRGWNPSSITTTTGFGNPYYRLL